MICKILKIMEKFSMICKANPINKTANTNKDPLKMDLFSSKTAKIVAPHQLPLSLPEAYSKELI